MNSKKLKQKGGYLNVWFNKYKKFIFIKIRSGKKYDYINFDLGQYWLANTPRFILAKKYGSFDYVDVFTNTKYSNDRYEGKETVIEARSIITTRKYITTKEANLILQELNPTYLKEKKLIKRRKTN